MSELVEKEKYNEFSEFVFKEFKKLNAKITKLENDIDKLKSEKKKPSNKQEKPDKNPKSTADNKIEKKGKVTLDKYSDKIIISGQTYHLKYILKKYKSIWDPDIKSWKSPIDTYEELYQELKNNCELVNVNIKSSELTKEDESDMKYEAPVFEFLDDD